MQPIERGAATLYQSDIKAPISDSLFFNSSYEIFIFLTQIIFAKTIKEHFLKFGNHSTIANYKVIQIEILAYNSERWLDVTLSMLYKHTLLGHYNTSLG